MRQVGSHLGEAHRGQAGGDALLGVAPPLLRQPLLAGRQPHPEPRQRCADLPVAHLKLGRDPGDAMTGVAAGLQIPAQILKAVPPGAFLQAPVAAAIHYESALKGQPTRRFCWLWVCPCFAGPAAQSNLYRQLCSTASPP
jgi:hypothetical protein